MTTPSNNPLGLVLHRSAGGFTIHAPDTPVEAIQSGSAYFLVAGYAEPCQSDWLSATMLYMEQALTPHIESARVRSHQHGVAMALHELARRIRRQELPFGGSYRHALLDWARENLPHAVELV